MTAPEGADPVGHAGHVGLVTGSTGHETPRELVNCFLGKDGISATGCDVVVVVDEVVVVVGEVVGVVGEVVDVGLDVVVGEVVVVVGEVVGQSAKMIIITK